MKVFLTILFVALSAPLAFAGNGGVGGGVGYKCGEKIYLADTYKLLYESQNVKSLNAAKFLNKVRALNQLTPDQIVKGLVASLNVYLYKIGESEKFEQINQALKNLNFVEKEKVVLTRDHHITSSEVPCGGHIVQLARQYASGLVEVANAVKVMTPLEQALLKFHEIRLRVLYEQNQFKGDTTPVRGWVGALTELTLTKVLKFAVINGGMGSIPGSAYGTVNKDGTYTWTITKLDCDYAEDFCMISLAAKGSGSSENTGVDRKALNPFLAKAGTANVNQLVGYSFKSEIKVGIYALDAYRIEIITNRPYIAPTEDEVVELAAAQVARMECPDFNLVDRETVLGTFLGSRLDDFRNQVASLSRGQVVVSKATGGGTPSSPSNIMIVKEHGRTLTLSAQNGLRCVGMSH